MNMPFAAVVVLAAVTFWRCRRHGNITTAAKPLPQYFEHTNNAATGMPMEKRELYKKRTMVRDRVGMVRAPCFELPPDGFVYGKKNEKDAEGAGEVLSTWVAARLTEGKQHERSYVKANMLAVRAGHITAKTQRKFAHGIKNIRMRDVPEHDEDVEHRFVGPFGRKTQYPDENVATLISADYTDFCRDDIDYPDFANLTQRGKLPLPRETKAYQLQAARTQQELAAAAQPKSEWKMKKFQKVQSKLRKQEDLESP